MVVLDLKKDEKFTYLLVTSEEADAPSGGKSRPAPRLARSLLGKEVGDTVKLQVPGGARELEILELQTIHDLAK